MTTAEIATRYHETAGRYKQVAAACLDVALGQGDAPEKPTRLRTAGLWLALAELAKRMENRV